MADIDYESRAKKFHEGWVQHQPGNSRGWTKYWMVLRGMMLFIFNSKETTHETMKGTLTVTRDTEIRNLPPDSKKKGFKFELETVSAAADRKVNRLKFETENEKDLWKSFIFGIANGIVPSDVHLLPGQLKDVHEAIGEVRSTPPPLPSMDRPMTIPRPATGGAYTDRDPQEQGFSKFVTGTSVEPNGRPRRRPSTGSAGSGDSGGPNTQLPRGPPPPQYPSHTMQAADPGGGGAGGVNNLRELRRRQAELTNKALTSPTGGDRPSWSNDPVSDKLHAGDNWLFKKPDSSSPPSSDLGGSRSRVNHNQYEDRPTYSSDDFVRPPTRRPDHTNPPPPPPAQPPPPPQQHFQADTFVRPPPHPVSTMARDERSVDPFPAAPSNGFEALLNLIASNLEDAEYSI